MKKKNLNLNKKLILNKDTVTNLESKQQYKLMGGGATDFTACVTYCGTCPNLGCGPTQNTCQTVCGLCPISNDCPPDTNTGVRCCLPPTVNGPGCR